MNAFLSGLESSGWLKHIKAVMDTSAFISKVSNYSYHKSIKNIHGGTVKYTLVFSVLHQ